MILYFKKANWLLILTKIYPEIIHNLHILKALKILETNCENSSFDRISLLFDDVMENTMNASIDRSH